MAGGQVRRIGLIATLCPALLMAACGGGDGEGRRGAIVEGRLETPDLNPSPPTTAQPRFTVVRADAVAARRALLTLEDLGSAWEQSGNPAPPDADDDRCFGGAESARRKTAEVISPFFVRGESTRVATTIAFFADEQSAQDVLRLARDPASSSCITESTRGELAEVAGTSFDSAEIATSFTDPGQVADESAGVRVRISAPDLGEPRPVFIENTLARRGRVVVTLSALSLGEPLGGPFATELLAPVLARLPST